MKRIILSFCVIVITLPAFAQSFDLPTLLKQGRLVVQGSSIAKPSEKKGAIVLNGIVWLKDYEFSEGTIEIDLKGRDVLQKSFIGIAFHGVDTVTYDGVYFRPFNFRNSDPVRKIHAVQYISEPDYPWHRTRKEFDGVYEKAVTPAPNGEEWFHAKIVVDGKTVTVYVNGSTTPSLTVTKLNNRTSGRIGFWNNELDGEFARLVITKK